VPHGRAWLVECIGTWAVHMACMNGALALITVHGTWDGLNVPCGMVGNGANSALHGRGYCERDWPRACTTDAGWLMSHAAMLGCKGLLVE